MSASPFVNPFGPTVGQPLDDNQVDIADINQEAFESCQRLVDDVAAGAFSAALTVFGESGTGKTHLVGRVRKWLERQPGTLFVFVRMETSPAGMWRHLRRHLAVALLRNTSEGVRTLDLLMGPHKSELESCADRDLSIVLEHLLEGRHVRDGAAWLRGEGLPEDVLSSMRLSTPGMDDDLEVISRHLVLSICELIRPGVVVFCMDQIEAVMSSPGDGDGPHALGKAVSCLVEETRNAAVICCVQDTFMNFLAQVLDNSAKSKMMGRRAAIHPLSWEQAKRLIGARMGAEGAKHESGWPLTEKRFHELFKGNAAPARSVIQHCKDLFDESRSGRPTVEEPVETALQGMLEERYTPKEAAETESVLRIGLPLLTRAAGLKYSVASKPSPLDFLVNDDQVTICLCNEVHATSLVNHLKKISQVWKPAPKRSLLLLRDARLGISPNAKVTHQRIAGIQGNGGRLMTVSQEAIEALAALRRLLSDAESGDLSHHGQAITAQAVEEWIAGHLPAALDTLVSELGSVAPVGIDLTPALADLLAEKKMVTLELAARSLEVTIGEVEETARRDPRQFGFLGGSLPALFQPLGGE